MIRTFPLHIALALVATATLHEPVQAQGRKDYIIETDYGIGFMSGKLQVKNIAADTIAAKAKFPKMAEYLRVRKAPITKLMNMNVLPAAWNDAVLQGQSGDIAGIITSRNGVDAPDGDYDVNYPCFVSMGDYRGKGTGFTNATPSASGRNMNTCLRFTGKANWIGTEFDQMNLIQASTWGVLSGATSYIESGTISGFRLEGDNPSWYNTTYTCNGMGMWDMGETWTVDHIFATNFNGYGIANVRGTPAKYSTISLFTNALGGIGLIGTQLNNIWIEGISGDDNPALIVQVDGYGRGAGGNLTVVGEKSESGKRIPNKGQNLLWQRSPCVGNVTVFTPQSDMNGDFIDASFVMNSREWGQTLNVFGYVAWNCRTMVHDISNGKRWAVASYSPQSFVWCSRNGGTLHDLTTSTMITGTAVNASDRLGMVPNNGTFDYVNGTPKYDITGGIAPPTCTATWVTGTRTCTQCANNVQTCTTPYVSSGTCTPTSAKPADIVEQNVACIVTPVCTWVLGTPGPWSNCNGSTKEQRTPYVSSVATCTPSAPKPADQVVTQPCSTSTSSAIDPNDVLIVVNTSDATSAAMGTAYANAWAIPVANIVSVNLGSTDNLSTTALLTSARSAIDAKAKQYTVLAFAKPSRFSSQSITSAITFGVRTVSALSVSELYQYSGTKPRTDNGVAPAFLLLSSNYIRKDAHGTKPQGTSILLLAKDVPSQSNPRGSARAGQTATGVTVWDNRSAPSSGTGAIGGGNNPCNYLSSACWLASRKITTPIVCAYQSMDLLGDAGTLQWAKGFFGDHVTSFGGYLPPGTNGTNTQGQTALTYELDKGASMSVGSVSEPWQGGNGALAQQFVNVGVFHPLFLAGKPVGVASYAAVQCPDRMLFAGDPLCAPFAP